MSRGVWLLIAYTVLQGFFHAATDWSWFWWMLLVVNALVFAALLTQLDRREREDVA